MTLKQDSKSQFLLNKALELFPSGVNSPVRAFKAVGGDPFFVRKAYGSTLVTEEETRLIDYVQSWGALILGHAHPAVVEAIQRQAEFGTSYGACHALEVELAEKIKRSFPSIDKLRFVNSGTEAGMSAIRLARGATGRDRIVKFEGCYHGHADSLLVKAGSGAATFGVPDSAGIPAELAKQTLTLPFNDIQKVEKLFTEMGDQIASIIVEPIPANMGVVLPDPAFLAKLREVTQISGSVLIFDEVVSGFRVGLGGAQELYNIQPDLTTLGKIIGGGLPVGAFGGKASLMDQLSPEGKVYQAGTLSGNPLAMAAGCAALDEIQKTGFYTQLEALATHLEQGIQKAIQGWGGHARVNRVGSMLTLFLTQNEIRNYDDSKSSDLNMFSKLFQALLKQGVFIPPSQFESWFVSSAHTLKDMDQTINSLTSAFQKVNIN